MIAGVSGLTLALLVNYVQGASVEDAQMRSMAAEQDFSFFSAFLSDFGGNYQSYTSYMAENNMRLPQGVMDYYNHLAQLPSTANLEEDIASSFPFTEFQTFVTEFPWYSSLLEEAGATTIFLPAYFESNSGSITAAPSTNSSAMNATVGNVTRSGNFSMDDASVGAGGAPRSSTSGMSGTSETKTTKTSHNIAAQNAAVPAVLLGCLALLL